MPLAQITPVQRPEKRRRGLGGFRTPIFIEIMTTLISGTLRKLGGGGAMRVMKQESPPKDLSKDVDSEESPNELSHSPYVGSNVLPLNLVLFLFSQRESSFSKDRTETTADDVTQDQEDFSPDEEPEEEVSRCNLDVDSSLIERMENLLNVHHASSFFSSYLFLRIPRAKKLLPAMLKVSWSTLLQVR